MLGDGEHAGGRRGDGQEGHSSARFASTFSDVRVPGVGDFVRCAESVECELLGVMYRMPVCQLVRGGIFDVVAQFD